MNSKGGETFRRLPGARGAGHRFGAIAAMSRVIFIAPVMVCAVALGGCWPFGRNTPPPQQRYFNALKMGNAAQASQIWLKMDAGDRMKFERGQDIRPSVSHQEVQQEITEHYAQQAEGDDSAHKQTQLKPGGAGLQNLPAYLNLIQGGSQPVTPAAPAESR